MSYPFADPPTESTLPPLRIHHFMLWTAVSAVLLTALKTSEGNDDFSQLQASSLASLLVQSVGLTGLLIGCYWRSQGLTFFDMPGHVAFVVQSINAAYLMAWTTINNTIGWGGNFGSGTASWLRVWLMYGWLIVGLIQLILYLYFARRFKGFSWWGTFFAVMGAITLLQYAFNYISNFFLAVLVSPNTDWLLRITVQMAFPLIFQAIGLLFWSLSIRRDRREKLNLHWSHWLGAVTWTAMWIASLISVIAFYFFPPDWVLEIGK